MIGTAPHKAAMRIALPALIAVDVALLAVRVLLYPPFMSQEGALAYLLEPLLLLLVYAVIILAATGKASPDRMVALRVGSVIGMVTGAMWVVNLALETFTDLSGLASIAATAPFLLGAFLLWGLAGGIAAWRTGSTFMGTLAAIWSGMICVLITITFGFILLYTSLPRLEQSLSTDPDFIRSHWTDLKAFAIANSFDSAFSHLVGALLVGFVAGTLGGLVGTLVAQRNQARRRATY